ncbi:MAG: hypothetical protein R2697_00485 [Ilumatobacteraceae bacterium]
MSVRTVVQYRRQTELTLIVMAAAIIGVACHARAAARRELQRNLARMGPFPTFVLLLVAVAHIAVRKLAAPTGTPFPRAFSSTASAS